MRIWCVQIVAECVVVQWKLLTLFYIIDKFDSELLMRVINESITCFDMEIKLL